MKRSLQLAFAGLMLVTSFAGTLAAAAAPAQAVGFEGTTTVTAPSGNTQTLGKSVTVVASTTFTLVNTGFYLQLYALDSGERLCASQGSPGVKPKCTATVWNTRTSANTRKFIAYVGLPAHRLPVSSIFSRSKPTWITWSNAGYTIRLERWFDDVIAVANKPVDGFAIIEIHHAVTEQLLTYCLSGTTCVVRTAEPTVAFVVPWDIAASSNTLG